MHVKEGDCFLLTQGRGFTLASEPGIDGTSADEVFTDGAGQARMGTGEEFSVLGGRMTLDPRTASLLTDALPPVMRVPAHSRAAASLRWLLQKVVAELGAGGIGSHAIATQAMHMMFVEMIRFSSTGLPVGWVAALADPRVGPALRAIHDDPCAPWTLERLAALSHLSRSVFAARFRAQVGTSPLNYLTRWKMHLARRSLRRRGVSVAEIAERLGYSSESAFGHAYKRVFGESPGRGLGRGAAD